MRTYKTSFSVYQNIDINKIFFSNTTIFLNAYPIGIEGEPLINNIFSLQTILKIKGGKNEIDITDYNINTNLDKLGRGRRCIILNKIYD
jgi:hypothetical protein